MRLKEKIDIAGAKVLDGSYVKDPAEKLALQRLRILELAEKLGNAAEACRQGRMDRTSFHMWKRRFQTHGLEGLKDLPPIRKTHPNAKPEPVRQAVLELSAKNPAWGSKRLAQELELMGMQISNFTVQEILKRAGLGSKFQRYLKLEEQALAGAQLSPEHLRMLEKLNPCFRERHVESSLPGELVSMDTFYVGVFKGIGRVYLHTAVDTFGSYAFGMLATERNSLRAAELLYGQLMPFYESHGFKLQAVLTDNGTEFCGTQSHPFEQTCFQHGIAHRRTRVKRPQTNGFAERFHRTILDEFFRIELRKKAFETLEELEVALQEWLCRYNLKRPHQGYRNLGRTPYQTVEANMNKERQDA
jgi:transposase InsO family protein